MPISGVYFSKKRSEFFNFFQLTFFFRAWILQTRTEASLVNNPRKASWTFDSLFLLAFKLRLFCSSCFFSTFSDSLVTSVNRILSQKISDCRFLFHASKYNLKAKKLLVLSENFFYSLLVLGLDRTDIPATIIVCNDLIVLVTDMELADSPAIDSMSRLFLENDTFPGIAINIASKPTVHSGLFITGNIHGILLLQFFDVHVKIPLYFYQQEGCDEDSVLPLKWCQG